MIAQYLLHYTDVFDISIWKGLYNTCPFCKPTLLVKNLQLRTLFVPYLEPSGKRVPKRGSLHVQEPKKVPYITKNGSKEPK